MINLQSSDYEEDLAQVARDFRVRVHVFEDLDLYDDLDDAAALSAAIDMMISVPTVAGAISAAVGTPTWLITWRQSIYNNALYGYRGPFVTRFERNTGETWDGVFKIMAERLRLRMME